MPKRKRRTKKQIAAAKKQSERMKKYWAKKKAENNEAGDFEVWIIETRDIMEDLFNKVYMAGWNKNKSPHIRHVYNQISIQDALELVEEQLRTWKI